MNGSDEVRKVHGFKWFLVVLAILSSLFLYALDNTIVANIVPAIVAELGNAEQLAWLSVGFTAGGLCLLLLLGKLYPLFDPKWVFISSAVLFLAGSALCGAAPNMNAMIVGRIIAGIGGNGLYMGSVTLLSLNTTPQERPTYLSFNGVVWGIGTVLGPVIGGVFEKVTWRWAFYINLCIGAVCAPVWLFLLPSSILEPPRSIRTRIAQLDWLGTILITVAMLPLILAIDFGGRQFAWSSTPSIVLFVIGGVFLILFALQQQFNLLTNHRDRLFPIHFMRNAHAVLLATLAASCDVFTFVPIYYIPLYFQFTRGDNALTSAVRLLPYITLLSTLILANGAFMSKFGHYKIWYVVGSALSLAATVLLSTIGVNTPTAQIYGFEVLLGIGSGAFVQAGYAALFSILSPEDMAFGTSFMMLAQLCGITFGLAICSAIFVNEAVLNLRLSLPSLSEQEIQSAIQGVTGDLFRTLDAQAQSKLVDILVQALRKTFIPCYAAAALCLVLSIVLPHKKMYDQKSSDSSVAEVLPELEDGVNTAEK